MIADTSLQRFCGPWVRRSQLRDYGLLIIGLCVATIVTTWPHARLFTTHVVSHIDPLFSMWRLAWFAHAIQSGEHLLHANVFYPEPFTYLLSDATFLQSALAAPGIWSGVALPTVYNTLILIGIVSSGVAMYWLATSLGIRRSASVLAAAVFSLAPYRIEHIAHLELQWIAPAIVALGTLYRLLYAPQWRHGVILGIAVWLQFLSKCVLHRFPAADFVAAGRGLVPNAARITQNVSRRIVGRHSRCHADAAGRTALHGSENQGRAAIDWRNCHV